MTCRLALLLLFVINLSLAAAPLQPATQPAFLTTVPAHPADLVLSRPTASAITFSVLFYADTQAYIAYGADPASLAKRTPVRAFKASQPAELLLDSLLSDTQYHYELRAAADALLLAGRFHTQRPANSAFTFTIQADSHLDEHATPDLYCRTLANARADKPDFHIDLADTFMTEKHPSRESAAPQYLAQRYYLGAVGPASPLFLVLGNHDGEGPRQYDATPDSLAVWSNTQRKRFFPNPVPDGFYTGNKTPDKFAGLLQNYYAFTWGDGLFIALDPFWHSARPRGRNDGWAKSLGDEQYAWLAKTLEASTAAHKFVFIHHLTGGLDNQSRGGISAAPYFEWGGKNADGTDGFKSHRSWPLPIHQLLVRHHVDAVFHGHDHLYACETLDGIVYQAVPQPAFRGFSSPRNAAEYGYTTGTVLGSSGHLRVTVTKPTVTVEYIRAILPEDETPQRRNATVAHRYTIPAATSPASVR